MVCRVLRARPLRSRVLCAQDPVAVTGAAHLGRYVKRRVHRDRSELGCPKAIGPPLEIDRLGFGALDTQQAGGAPRKFRTVVDAEFGEQRRDVKFYSTYRDVELGGDFLVRAVAQDGLPNLFLPGAEAGC